MVQSPQEQLRKQGQGSGPADVTARLRAAEQRIQDLEQRLATDEMTGVLRRAAGEQALRRELNRSRRSGTPLCLAFIDVDELKAVNDSQGHAAGDRLLQGVAAALREGLRAYDIIVRWGGDEFVCLMPGSTIEHAVPALARIRRRTSEGGGFSFSAGFAQLERGDTVRSLVERADSALYSERRRAR